MEDSSRWRALPGHQVRGNSFHALCVPCFQVWVSCSNNSRTFFCCRLSPVASVRRTSRLRAAQPPASPCYLSPRPVTRRSLALSPVPAAPSQCFHTPSRPRLTPVPAPKSLCGTPPSPQKQHAVKASAGLTPAGEALPGGGQPEADSECSMVTNAPAAASEAEEQTAEAADVVLPSTRERLAVVCPGAEPSHLSFTLSPCASGSPASISPQLPAEAQNTSAVEVTNLLSPTFLLIHRMRPETKFFSSKCRKCLVWILSVTCSRHRGAACHQGRRSP